MKARFVFSKQGKVRFTSHRDVARMWERALRLAGAPVAYSEGFSPRPRLSFGLALPTGYESLGEYIDIELRDEKTSAAMVAEMPGHLSAALPAGMVVYGVALVQRRVVSLQQAVTSCNWEITVPGADIGSITEWISRVLDAPSIVVTRERKGKPVTDDLRPNVLDLRLADGGRDDVCIIAELGTQPRALRPKELLGAFEPPLVEGIVTRTNQWILLDGARSEPLAAGAAPAALTEVGA